MRRRSTRRPPQRPSLLAISSQLSHSFMRYTISRGSAHSSLSLDVGVAATPIPHSNPISLYTTRSKFNVGVRVWPTARRSVHPSQCALQLRPGGSRYVWRTMQSRRRTAVQQHRWQQTPRSAPSNCRRNLKRLNVTICARAHTTLNYHTVVRVSQTAVTLNACYSRIFTKCCSTLLTELTVLTVK